MITDHFVVQKPKTLEQQAELASLYQKSQQVPVTELPQVMKQIEQVVSQTLTETTSAEKATGMKGDCIGDSVVLL
jgi:predicted transcriptional regulator